MSTHIDNTTNQPTPRHWDTFEETWVLLQGNLHGHFLAGLFLDRRLEGFFLVKNKLNKYQSDVLRSITSCNYIGPSTWTI